MHHRPALCTTNVIPECGERLQVCRYFLVASLRTNLKSKSHLQVCSLQCQVASLSCNINLLYITSRIISNGCHVVGTGWFTEDPLEITNQFGGQWKTSDFRAGDVLIFNMRYKYFPSFYTVKPSLILSGPRRHVTIHEV